MARNQERPELPRLCDVPDCGGVGQEAALGHLCPRHAERFERDLGRNTVFATEVFLGSATAEDDLRAREECYSRWLGEVRS